MSYLKCSVIFLFFISTILSVNAQGGGPPPGSGGFSITPDFLAKWER